MKALKSRAAVIAGAVLATTAMLVPLAAPAGAVPLADGCTFSTNPASGGSQSALRVACNFPTPANVPASNVISDFSNAVWHNGAARAINGVAFQSYYGLTGVYSPNAHFTAADTNHQIAGTIGGTAIGAYTNVKVVVDASTVLLNMPATTTGVSGITDPASGLAIDAKLENSSIRAGVGAVVTASVTALAATTVSAKFNAGAAGTGSVQLASGVWDATWVGATITSNKITGGSGVITSVLSNKANISAAIPTKISTAENASVARAGVAGRVISPTLGFNGTDVGRSIGGTSIAADASIAAVATCASGSCGSSSLDGFTVAVVSGATTALYANLAASPAFPNQITVGADEIVSTTRIVNNHTYDLANQRISSDAGTFRGSDIGLPISGCGVASYANGASLDTQGQNYIDSVAVDGSWVHTHGGIYGNSIAVVSGATCAQAFSSYGINLTIGLPSVSSAVNGDVMSTIASTLNLSPSLVPGSDACAKNTYEGTTIQGQWYNPGFIGASSAFSGNPSPSTSQSVSLVLSPALAITPIAAPSNTIGAIKYPTAVVSFWAFVSLRTSSETVGNKTFAANTAKISLPWVPTLLALCPNTGISSEYTFQGTSIGTQSIATGTGRPSTALRGLRSGAVSGAVAYQTTTAASVTSIWTGNGEFAAGGALGQGVSAALTKQP